jgi:hypothetical protein
VQQVGHVASRSGLRGVAAHPTQSVPPECAATARIVRL